MLLARATARAERRAEPDPQSPDCTIDPDGLAQQLDQQQQARAAEMAELLERDQELAKKATARPVAKFHPAPRRPELSRWPEQVTRLQQQLDEVEAELSAATDDADLDVLAQKERRLLGELEAAKARAMANGSASP